MLMNSNSDTVAHCFDIGDFKQHYLQLSFVVIILFLNSQDLLFATSSDTFFFSVEAVRGKKITQDQLI